MPLLSRPPDKKCHWISERPPLEASLEEQGMKTFSAATLVLAAFMALVLVTAPTVVLARGVPNSGHAANGYVCKSGHNAASSKACKENGGTW